MLPYSPKLKAENLSKIFNQDQMNLIYGKLHKSIYFLHVFTE